MNAPVCEVHGTEMKYREGGVSKKTGKPYNGFWSCGKKDDFGGYCDYKPPQAPQGRQGAAQRFNESMAASDQQNREAKKDMTITKLAIAKSLIEAGRKFDVTTVKEFHQWLNLVEGKTVPVTSDPNEEIAVDNIPF